MGATEQFWIGAVFGVSCTVIVIALVLGIREILTLGD